MSVGRILATDHHGAYVLKLVGDVRVNLCSSIDDYIDRMFADPELESVLIDLCEAQGIDSTTLGLLAKLALRFKGRFHCKPVIYSDEPGINRLLYSMAFGKLFEIRERSCEDPADIDDIPSVSGTDESTREKVIEAHKVLADISEENRERFSDLIVVLEEGRKAG